MPERLAAENPPLAIFHHVHLTSSDPPAAIQWYLKNLGGRITKVGPFDAVLYGTTNVLFTKKAEGFPGSVGSSVDHVGFSYKDIDAKMKELADAGVEIVSGVEQEGPIKYAFVKDPWGTLIEIVEDAADHRLPPHPPGNHGSGRDTGLVRQRVWRRSHALRRLDPGHSLWRRLGAWPRKCPSSRRRPRAARSIT